MTQPNRFRVCTFESRRCEEMSRLIEKFGGVPTVAPSLREVPLSDNAVAFECADRLLNGQLDLVIFMTGVGTDALFSMLEAKNQLQPVLQMLARIQVVARGPKPAAVLSRFKVRIDHRAPEPNTWRELVGELDRAGVALEGTRVAVQEYGAPSTDLYDWLREHGAEVMPVPIYRWALPEDLGPLRQSVRDTVNGEFDVLLFTSAQQANHAAQVAEELHLLAEWVAAANRCVIGSIGPTASERLREFSLIPDLEPSHPKMAHLIRESLEQAPGILAGKQS